MAKQTTDTDPVSAYTQKQMEAEEAQKAAEQIKADAVNALLASGKSLVEQLAKFGVKYVFQSATRKPRGPNKPKPQPIDEAA